MLNLLPELTNRHVDMCERVLFGFRLQSQMASEGYGIHWLFRGSSYEEKLVQWLWVEDDAPGVSG